MIWVYSKEDPRVQNGKRGLIGSPRRPVNALAKGVTNAQ